MKRRLSIPAKKTRQGGAVVEAAVTMPLLIIVTFGAIDVSQYLSVAQQISQASREGARIVSRGSTNSVNEVEEGVLDFIVDCFPNKSRANLDAALTVVVMRESIPKSIVLGGFTNADSGDPISVSVAFDFSAIRWLPGPTYWDSNVKTTKTFCRRD